jgi:hypothetical protein
MPHDIIGKQFPFIWITYYIVLYSEANLDQVAYKLGVTI